MLRAMVAGEQVDAAIVTTATACTLRNKGVNCRIAVLHTSPLWIVSSETGPQTLNSLQGTLLFPFGPGEMPELLYKAALNKHPSKAATRHTGGALEAVNLLLAGQGNHALLSEPMASMAILRSQTMQARGAVPLTKSIDMRNAWQQAFPGHQLTSSCVAFFGSKADDRQLIHSFSAAYAPACQWIHDNPDKALKLARKTFPMLAKQMEQGVLGDLEVHILQGEKARSDALFYLARINDISPDAIGGAMPDDDLFEVSP